MRKNTFILAVLAGISLMSCREAIPNGPSVEEEPSLGLCISFPVPSVSKGEVGPLPATDLENALHSLTVWVFTHEKPQTLVAYKEIPEADFPVAGGVRRYSLPVTRDFANAAPNVDVFVLANAASIGSTLGMNSSWEELNNASFGRSEEDGKDYFGIGSPISTIDPSLGLPMSGVGYDMAIQGDAPILTLETITLRRAVSRLRFVFCKTKTEGEEDKEVSINQIILSGHQIPLREYVFASTSSGIVYNTQNEAASYVDEAFVMDGPSSIAENETPENYIYVNQDPVSYQQLLDNAVSEGTLTDMGHLYFRESDKRLIGWVDYTVDGAHRTREFSMASAGDFARNHSWTLLGFFLSGRNMQLALSVIPWDMNSYTINFTDQSVMVYSPFIVSENSAVLTETSKDKWTARLKPGVSAKGRLQVVSPIGGRLMIKPIGDVGAFVVSPEYSIIDPATNGGYIDITVSRKPEVTEDVSGSKITLSFSVEIGDRTIDANSEVTDREYTFIL